MKRVLVTGANGQLGRSILKITQSIKNIDFVFKSSKELDITDHDSIGRELYKNNYSYLVNCAAYTAVDKAEDNKEKAFEINAEAAGNLAKKCVQNQIILIHISTDFVFDGSQKTPYKETDPPNPINVYGASKLKGEEFIREITENHFILRTSWVYSEYGSNFVKTMLRLSTEQEKLRIVNNQTGTPTYATDLAEVITHIILNDINKFGTYHFSNKGETNWFDFARTIFWEVNKEIEVVPVPSSFYPSKALRPAFSVLDKTKIILHLGIVPNNWEVSLKNFLKTTKLS